MGFTIYSDDKENVDPKTSMKPSPKAFKKRTVNKRPALRTLQVNPINNLQHPTTFFSEIHFGKENEKKKSFMSNNLRSMR